MDPVVSWNIDINMRTQESSARSGQNLVKSTILFPIMANQLPLSQQVEKKTMLLSPASGTQRHIATESRGST